MAASDARLVRVEDYRLAGLTDAQVIEAALQAATTLGARDVVFAPRTYELDHAIRPPSHVSLVGNGATVTFAPTGPGFSFFLIAGVEDVGLAGFVFRNRGRTQANDDIDVHAVNVQLSRDVTIADSAFHDLKAIHLNGATDVAVTGNVIRRGSEAIVVGGLRSDLPSWMSSGIVIAGNDIEGQSRETIDLNQDARDVLIANNRLAGGNRAAGAENADELVDIGGGTMSGITVTGNLFDGLGRNAYALRAKLGVQDLVIEDNTIVNLFAGSYGAAITIGSGIGYAMTGNAILSGQDGVRIGAGSDGVLAGNRFGDSLDRNIVLRHADGVFIVVGGPTEGAPIAAAAAAGPARGRLVDPGSGHDTVIGGLGADTLRGAAGNDVLEGGDGGDSLAGGAGADRITAGRGGDRADGGSGADTMAGGPGADTLLGSADADRLGGDAGEDSLDGGDADDTLSGAEGRDTLLGAAGADSLSGGDGNDRAEGGDGADMLDGDQGNDTLLGGAAGDRLSGGWGNDLLDGGDAADTLLGGRGADRLLGGAGSDILTGGAGADTLVGGADPDLFVFGAGSGADVVGDFATGLDRLSVPRALLADPLASLAETPAGLVLQLLDGGTVLLQGVHALAAGDIVIA